MNPSTNGITKELLLNMFIVVLFCVYVYTTLNYKLTTVPSVNTTADGVIVN